MFLESLHIKGFRCISNLKISFQRGLNVLIGENNSGKTTIIDALRLSLGIGPMRRDIYVSSDDFHINLDGVKSDIIEFDLIFTEPTIEEQGVFYELLAMNENVPKLQIHIRYKLETKRGIERIRFSCWGGEHEGQIITSEVFLFFYYVYLGALRDAEKDLSPNRGNRISQLFLKLVEDPDSQKEYAKDVQEKINELENWRDLTHQAKEKVNEHLDKLMIDGSNQEIDISHLPFEYKRIVENLKMQLLKKLDQNSNQNFEIYQNGLGFNNLIYIATVLGDIFERKEREKESFISLFIEEPEAHLHPQLQNILFNFLKKTSEEKIQIFITSHSPTVSAKAQINSISILQNFGNKITATPINHLPIDSPDKKKLERFLDVTKAQMFFSKGVILVEGISEALLIPVFSEILEIDLDQTGIEIVNIGGVAFSRFAKMFNSSDERKRLRSKCAIITDDDSHIYGTISQRAENTKALTGGNLDIFLGTKTFEFELYSNGNEDIIKEVYNEMHPQTEISGRDDFLKKLESNKDKAEFAQNLALKLQSEMEIRTAFKIPSYIEKAIKWVISQ